MLQHVPTKVGQGLCITSPHRILGVCVAAILPDPCVLGTQGSRTSQRDKKPERVVWLQIKSPFEDCDFNLWRSFFVVVRHRNSCVPMEVLVEGDWVFDLPA